MSGETVASRILLVFTEPVPRVHWKRLPRDAVGLPTLEIRKTWLDTALSSLL